MKTKIPAILLAILCIALSLTLYSARQENSRLKQQISDLANTSDNPKSTPVKTLEPEDQTTPAIAAQSAIEEITPSTETPDAEKEAGQRMMGNVAKMMDENPTMNKIVEASQRGVMGALYSDFIEYLDLNADESQYFMDLLMQRQMKKVELGMKMMSGQLSEEEQAALMEEVKLTTTTVKGEMKNFLNSEEDFAEFEFYEKTIGERMLLSQVDSKLAGTDSVLSESSYNEVLKIMHEERNNFPFTNDLGDNESMDMSAERFSQVNIDLYMKETLELGENINRQLETILTPEQMAAYLKSGEAMLNLQASQLQQAKQAFGGE